ncbi:hypothetical protein E2C01_030238 [Portunus trituberculatus]|uniref:Uncharacterized protein n=1 Tax=Portunus trituberculatus TaxID=210409 RepID=A0A5B7EPX6_PORTR|nr:hypothetical protein [Portunus trituberculatus]
MLFLGCNFAILKDLKELVQHLYHIPDRLADTPNIFTFSLPLILVLMLLPYLLRWVPLISTSYLCILSYISNPFSGYPKAEMPLAFLPLRVGGPEKVLC